MSDTFSAAALYELAKRLHPDGITREAFIPVEVEGSVMELRCFTDQGDGTYVSFCFFRANARYARRSIIVRNDGRIEPDDDGVIPDFDKQDDERPITWSPEDLAQVAFSVLQSNITA